MNVRVFFLSTDEDTSHRVSSELDRFGFEAIVARRPSALKAAYRAGGLCCVLLDAALIKPNARRVHEALRPALPLSIPILLLGDVPAGSSKEASFRASSSAEEAGPEEGEQTAVSVGGQREEQQAEEVRQVPWPVGPGVLSDRLRREITAARKRAEERSEDVTELAADIEIRHVRLSRQNFYERLDLGIGAGSDAIKAAHDALSLRFHPDRMASRLDNELREKAMQVYLAIREAYRTLKNVGSRREYERRLEDDTP